MTRRFTLKKHERLKSKKSIDLLFNKGKSVFSHPIKALFLDVPISSIDDWSLKFGVAVPKKKVKKAVTRNLIKRRIREAYRLNKTPLQEKLKSKEGRQLILMLIFIENTPVEYFQIEKAVTSILEKIINEI